VKVLSDGGSGTVSDVIAGVNWVAQEKIKSGKPIVASMSLGGGPSPALDAAVVALYNQKVTVVVAAGNNNEDAINHSPARVKQAITVAASTILDAKATFSNFGSVVDIWAPGFNVISTWNDGGARSISGTSMATPHVAGFAAYLLGFDSTLTPDQIAKLIDDKSLKSVLTGVPAGTPNKLLNNKL
jgi:cerevisin